MQRRSFFSAFVAVLIVGSFAAGVLEPELRAQGSLPEIFSSLRPTGARELDPLNTYKRVMDVVRERYYGEVPTERKMTYTAVRGLLATLDDPYTRFLDPEEYAEIRQENQGEFEGIGAQLEGQPTKEGFIRIDRPLPDGPAQKAGIQRGDLIVKIDGKPVPGTVDAAVRMIRGKAGTPVVLTIRRGEREFDVKIVRAPVEFNVVSYAMKQGDIGYVSLGQFNEMADLKLERAIRDLEAKGMKGLILDLRGNPGGLLESAIDIASRFIPQGKEVVQIVEGGEARPEVRRTNGRKFLARWPVVVLVNGTSASASEIVAGAIKDHKAGTVVGKTTFGKGLVQTLIQLEDGSACLITTAKYLTPSGKDINRSRQQRGGVEPDVTVEMTEEQYYKGEDPQLGKAIELIRTQLKAVAAR